MSGNTVDEKPQMVFLPDHEVFLVVFWIKTPRVVCSQRISRSGLSCLSGCFWDIFRIIKCDPWSPFILIITGCVVRWNGQSTKTRCLKWPTSRCPHQSPATIQHCDCFSGWNMLNWLKRKSCNMEDIRSFLAYAWMTSEDLVICVFPSYKCFFWSPMVSWSAWIGEPPKPAAELSSVITSLLLLIEFT